MYEIYELLTQYLVTQQFRSATSRSRKFGFSLGQSLSGLDALFIPAQPCALNLISHKLIERASENRTHQRIEALYI